MPHKIKRRPSVSRKLKIIMATCLALAMVLTLGALYIKQQEVLTANAAEAAKYTPKPATVAASNPTAAFLGDSFTEGTGLGGVGPANWSSIVSYRHGWIPSVHAIGGTGFVNGKSEGKNFGARVDDVIAAGPDIVIVAGAGNDIHDPEAAQVEMKDVIVRLQDGLPDAEVVLIAPLWLQQEEPEGLAALRAVTQDVVAETGVTWIDPAGWLQGRPELLGEDGVHPTDQGNKVLADLVSDALAASDVTLPVAE